jgi:hypothetical protein
VFTSDFVVWRTDALASTVTWSVIAPTMTVTSTRVTTLIGTLTPVWVYGLNPVALTERS